MGNAHKGSKARFRSGALLDGSAAVTLAFGLLAAHAWIRVTSLSGADMTAADFMSFYAAGTLAGAPDPTLVYDVPSHLAAERSFQGGSTPPYTHFLYPPISLLWLAPLATAPYWAAFLFWVSAQVGLFVAAARSTAGRWVPVVCCLAFPAALQSAVMGQNSLLTAAVLLAGFLAFSRDRPLLAGLILGCLAYKPHLGLLMPVAFIAAREWKAALGAAASVLALIALSAGVFGVSVWWSYLSAFGAGANEAYGEQVPHALYATVTGFLMAAGFPVWAAGAAQAVAAALATGSVVSIWRRAPRGSASRPVSLVAGTLLVLPVAMFYDLLASGVCLLWIAAEARRGGWLSGEKALLSTCFVLSFVAGMSNVMVGFPCGPVVNAIMLALAWRRAAARA